MQQTVHRRRFAVIAVSTGLGAALAVVPTAAVTQEAVGSPAVHVYAAPTTEHWDPLTDDKWAFERGQVILTERGTNPGLPRRPFEYHLARARAVSSGTPPGAAICGP